ncbi:hypothetical protein EMCRGX_G017454 [Ephydatia muelleri]
MGVDLDTYRARIGSFISRRNVNCDGEKRKIAIMKERFRLKIDLKAVDSWKPRVLECATINASSSFKKGTHGLDVHVSTKLPMGLLSPKSTHCARHWSRAVAMFILTLLVSYLLIKQLLILSGNIEMNPGPLGQPDPTFTLKNITSALKPVVEWKKLAVQLDISGTKIKEIDVNNRGQMAECKHDMVQFWLESDTSCSWKKLVDALNTCDQSVLAEKVKSTYCPLHEGANLSIYIDPSLDAATLSSIESPKGWNKYTRDLKYRYRNHKPAQVDFPPVATYSYVNLALIKDTTSTHRDEFFLNTIQGSVDDVAETKVTISYHDLFGSITPNNRILLLEGRPGCGKTTDKKKNRKIELKDLESLPSPEISMFQIISKLAYTTVVTSKTSFIPVELRSMFEEISIASLANLGILVVDENEEVCGASHVLTFVHRTHQEFLAAYYASRLSSDKQLKAIREDIVQPHMGVVLKFFCGITKLQNPDHWSVIMKNVLTTEYGEMGPVTLRALHCVFEAQNRQRCRELYSKADGKLHINNETLTLLDYCVIGYCLESASDTVRSIELQCQLTADGLDIITKKIQDDLCQKEKLLALKHLLQKLPNVKSLDLARCFRDEAWSDWFLLGELLKQTSHLQILR